MDLREYVLPEYVACYAMYGDPSGDDELDSAYDNWLALTMKHEGFSAMHLVDVKEQGFMRYHELEGVGSCDTGVFVFDCVASA